MKIAVFGAGYVGLVTAVGLAELGNSVTVIDLDENKLDNIKSGCIPFYEPGLEEMTLRNVREGRLAVMSDGRQAVQASDIIFIAVGTPSKSDGSPDMDYVNSVAREIGYAAETAKVIVIKSTVPVGTCENISEIVNQLILQRGLSFQCTFASNPEFLKEGSAIDDFMKPGRIIIGSDSRTAMSTLQELYKPLARRSSIIIEMDSRSSELSKYAANAMLATRISFMNQIAELIEKTGGDIELIRKGIGSDPRIGASFLYAGAGYGGSCFPKDVRALIHTANALGVSSSILQAVENVNESQKTLLLRNLLTFFRGDIAGKVVTVWGLSFKPDTDDMRESVSISVVRGLISAGATVQAYDPVATKVANEIFSDLSGVTYFDDMYQALQSSEALLLVTEWKQFRSPDFDKIKSLMKNPIIFDGRNQWDPLHMAKRGFAYSCVGRKLDKTHIRSSNPLELEDVLD